jgi:hypothetical protein
MKAPLPVKVYAQMLNQVLPIIQSLLNEEVPEDFMYEGMCILNILLYKFKD